MDVELIEIGPFRALVLDNVFGDEKNKKIFREALTLESRFGEAKVGSDGQGVRDEKIRSNLNCFYDEVFKGRRGESKLMVAIEELFRTDEFREILSCAGSPFAEFPGTNTHETQVSAYGGTNPQEYKFHVDRFGADMSRHISVVYWFFDEPKAFEGGNLEVSSELFYKGEKAGNGGERKTVECKNDRMIIFPSTMPHRVTPCQSPDEHKKKRFSVNCWVGFKR